MARSRPSAVLARSYQDEFDKPHLLPPGMAMPEAQEDAVKERAKKTSVAGVASADTSMDNYRKVANSIAWSPSRNLFMYMFMAWMTGSQLNVYTIFILQPLIMGPFTALMTMDKQFEPVASVGLDLTRFRVIYLFFSALGFAIVAYKMYQLGLLPVTSADWVSLLPTHEPAHRAWAAASFF